LPTAKEEAERLKYKKPTERTSAHAQCEGEGDMIIISVNENLSGYFRSISKKTTLGNTPPLKQSKYSHSGNNTHLEGNFNLELN
jgi:hypothetical protein